jgi:hypothetical protein
MAYSSILKRLPGQVRCFGCSSYLKRQSGFLQKQQKQDESLQQFRRFILF